MRMKTASHHFVLIAFSLICFSPMLVQGQYVAPQPSDGPGFSAAQSGKPSAFNEIFFTLKTQCEADVACGKANGDVCADAGALLIGNDPPDVLRGLTEVQRIKIALRLYEIGVNSSNLAAGRAYDLYSKADLFLGATTVSYRDPYRAYELMELMLKKSYPGATLRKALSTVSFFTFTVTEPEKKQACAMAAQMKAGGKLDVDSAQIANEVLEATICKAAAQPQSISPM